MIREDVRALARMTGLSPETLRWIGEDAASPLPPPPRYKYDALTDEEWEVISPYWPSFNQASTAPRDIVNALLKISSTGCGWGDAGEFASAEAIRQQFRRRKRSGVLSALGDAVRGRLTDDRQRQVELLATFA